MDEKVAIPLVLFVVVVLGGLSLVIVLSGGNGVDFAVINPNQKSSLGVLSAGIGCTFPQTVSDLLAFLSERNNVPFSMDTCPMIAQDFCNNLNSGDCRIQCLKNVQSSDGVCGSSASQTGITGQVVLTPEECKRLAMSYDISTTSFLGGVGAGAEFNVVNDPCTSSMGNAVSKVYSSDSPLQAYSRNLFDTGDVTGYVADDSQGQAAMEYVICKDGRAIVKIQGNTRCDST